MHVRIVELMKKLYRKHALQLEIEYLRGVVQVTTHI